MLRGGSMSGSTSLSQSYSSFSGVDIRVIINGAQVGSMQYVSYMIQREKAPNYIMGSVDPVSFARGKRGINGVIRGLLLDTDPLYMKSFDGEKALLDKDELFLRELDEKKTVQHQQTTQPALRRRHAPETRGKWEYIYDVFISFKVLPGGSFGVAAEECVKGAIVGVMETVAVSILSGGLAAVPAFVNLVKIAVTDCIGAVAESLIYSGGFTMMAEDFVNSFLHYEDAYEDHLKYIAEWNKRVDAYNATLKPTVRTISKTINSKSLTNYAFLKDEKYDLSNLGSNYVVAKPEYLDQILPFDIVIVAVNEYGQSAQMRIYGCEILSANTELSIDAMTLPYSLNFVAKTILPWRSFDLHGSEGSGPGGSSIKQVPESRYPGSILTSEPGYLNIGDELSEDQVNELFDDDHVFEDDEDDDGDGILNQDDALPGNPNESQDTDGDGVGDNQDPDDDNDGLLDGDDPNLNIQDDPARDDTGGHDGIEEPVDTDGDGIPDEDDDFPFDRDNDNIIDEMDPQPDAPREGDDLTGGHDGIEEPVDTDGDNFPDNVDSDDDNDGIPDGIDPEPLVQNDPTGDDLTGGHDGDEAVPDEE